MILRYTSNADSEYFVSNYYAESLKAWKTLKVLILNLFSIFIRKSYRAVFLLILELPLRKIFSKIIF